MRQGAKQEILDTLREIVEEIDALGIAASMSFGTLITNIGVAAGQEDQSIEDIPDPQFLEAAQAMLSGLREHKDKRTGPQEMWIYSVDRDGKPLGEAKKVRVPAPVHVPENGLALVSEYVSRLYGSEVDRASLIIVTVDDQRGIGIQRRGGKATLSVNVEWRQYPEQEQAMRQFFDSRRLIPEQDYLAGNGNVRDATRIFAVSGGESAEQTTDLCGSFLREIYGITETEGLTYLFEEHQNDGSP